MAERWPEISIRLLGPGDEPALHVLADEDEDFDVAGRSSPRTRLTAEDASAYLADPSVLHWVAQEGDRVVGHLLCYVERRRAGDPRQLLLYEVGVRESHRRRGVGTALVEAMRNWMRVESVEKVWVLADNPGAEAFYAACGFIRDADVLQLTLTL